MPKAGLPSGMMETALDSNFSSGGFTGLDFDRLQDYKNIDGTQRSWNRDTFENSAPKYMDNPYWTVYENYPEDQRTRFFGNVDLNVRITDDLSFNGGVYGDTIIFSTVKELP
jgi:hypothetical protein